MLRAVRGASSRMINSILYDSLIQDVTEDAAHDSLEAQVAVKVNVEQETGTGLHQVRMSWTSFN